MIQEPIQLEPDSQTRLSVRKLREALIQAESVSTLLGKDFLDKKHPLHASFAFFAKKQIRIALQAISILEGDVTGSKISSVKEGGEK